MKMSRFSSIIAGIVILILGLILLFFPGFTMAMFSICVGVGLVVAGISAFFTWFSMRGESGGGFVLAGCILFIIFGVICIAHPLAFAAVISWLIALLVIVSGIAQIAMLINAFELPGRGIFIASTVLMIIFGICALVWPALIVQFIGASLLIEGITEIFIGIKNKPIDAEVL